MNFKKLLKNCKECNKPIFTIPKTCSLCRTSFTEYELYLIQHQGYSEENILEERKRLKDIYKTLDKLN